MALRTHGDLLRVNEYVCSSAIRSGATVALNSSGLVVEQVGATSPILGVAIGYADGSNVTKVMVADHPDQEYIGENDDGSNFSQTDVGNNISVVAGSPYMTTESGNALDHANKDTTSTRAFRIVGLIDDKDSGNLTGAIVRVNNHQEKAGVTGV